MVETSSEDNVAVVVVVGFTPSVTPTAVPDLLAVPPSLSLICVLEADFEEEEFKASDAPLFS